MKKYIHCTISIILAVILVSCILEAFNPLRRSEESIREYVLRAIPIGTDIDAAAQIIEAKGWTIGYISREHGCKVDSHGDIDNSGVEDIGSQSIRAHLGTYYVGFRRDISAFLAFDEEGKLLDVGIRRDIDSL